jgi:hypothetical protein
MNMRSWISSEDTKFKLEAYFVFDFPALCQVVKFEYLAPYDYYNVDIGRLVLTKSIIFLIGNAKLLKDLM